MWANWIGLEAQRQRLLKKAGPGPLRDYLSVPFPDRRSPIDTVDIVSLDFETTGMDKTYSRILSAGYIELKHGEIKLETARHVFFKNDSPLNEASVIVHGITDDKASTGESLETAIPRLLEAMMGKVILSHHSRIERTFLQQACKRLYGLSPIFPMIDTLALAKKRLEQRNQPIEHGSLRLFALRESYGLPRCRAHNALSDALATAELFLAQLAHMDYKRPPSLGSLMS